MASARAGTAGAKATAVTRKRLSSENWSWLVKKGWVKAKVDALAEHTAYVETANRLTELVKSTLKDVAVPPFNTKPGIPK